MFRALALAAVAAVMVQGAQAASLREAIEQGLSSAAASEDGGVYNCQNKCQNLLGFLDYYTAKEQQHFKEGNNEYRGCMLGCNQCTLQRQTAGSAPEGCFTYCKNYNYGNGTLADSTPVAKGIIEPDKACIIGCVINLCQDMCTGDQAWGQGGCQIQTGYGIQTYSENVGSASFNNQCCRDAQNVCTYNGPQTPQNKNWNSVVRQARSSCNGQQVVNPEPPFNTITLTKTSSNSDICTARAYALAKSPPEC